MKILYAALAANNLVFHPKTGRFEGTVVSSRYPGIEMFLVDQGVKIMHKGATLLVPLHKFDFVELEPSDAKKTSK